MSNKQPIKLADLMPQVLESMESLKSTYGHFDVHESQQVDLGQVRAVLTELTDRLDDNFPFFHPQYAGQMLKPPHPVAMAAYMATMMLNPNNHSIDGGRATTMMEREVVKDLAKMFGYGEQHLGHLTWSGTTANLEALWISREINPGKAIAHSKDSHYTHSRMGEVLGVETIGVDTEPDGRMSLEALEIVLKTGKVGVVVVTVAVLFTVWLQTVRAAALTPTLKLRDALPTSVPILHVNALPLRVQPLGTEVILNVEGIVSFMTTFSAVTDVKFVTVML